MIALPSGNYVVVGASGLVGTQVLRLLSNQPGIGVSAVHHTRPLNVSSSNIRSVQADLLDPESHEALFCEADYLLLLAGVVAPAPLMVRDPVSPALANLRITAGCLEAAHKAGVKKVVWLSSTTVYPECNEDAPLTEDMAERADPPDVWYAMGWTMRYLEKLCRTYANLASRPMPIAVLRPSLIYGEHDHFHGEQAHFIPALVRRVVRRENPIEVWGDGEHRRDVIHAQDVARAVLWALCKVDHYDAFNICAGETVSVNDVVDALVDIDGYQGAKIVHLHNRPSTSRRRLFSNAKARDILGFEPEVGLRDGLKRTVAWFRAAEQQRSEL